MPDKSAPDNDRLAESIDQVVEPDAADPADLAGAAASETVDRQHDEVDQIAAEADPAGTGHGPSRG